MSDATHSQEKKSKQRTESKKQNSSKKNAEESDQSIEAEEAFHNDEHYSSSTEEDDSGRNRKKKTDHKSYSNSHHRQHTSSSSSSKHCRHDSHQQNHDSDDDGRHYSSRHNNDHHHHSHSGSSHKKSNNKKSNSVVCSCATCGQTFASEQGASHHATKYGHEGTNSAECCWRSCPECSKRCDNERDVDRHIFKTGHGIDSAHLKERGNTFFQNSKFEEAIRMYTLAIRKDFDNPLLYCNRAIAYLRLEGNSNSAFKNAIYDCEKALLLDPQCAKAAARLARGLIQLGNVEKGYLCCAQALEMPNCPVEVNNDMLLCGEVQLAAQEIASALTSKQQKTVSPKTEETLHKIIGIAPRCARYRLLRSILLVLNGAPENALDCLLSAKKACEKLKYVDSALKYFTEAFAFFLFRPTSLRTQVSCGNAGLPSQTDRRTSLQ